MVHADENQRTLSKPPLGYSRDKQLPGLMTLMGFVEGGHDTATAKVLLCVKSIGGRKRCRWNGTYANLAMTSSFGANSHQQERRRRGCGPCHGL